MEHTAFNNHSNVGNQAGRQTVHGDVVNNFYAGSEPELTDLDALSKLPRAPGAEFTSRQWEHNSECLSGTRVDLLAQIRDWISDPDARPIYWLTGMAGTGKSTIARSIARHCHDHKILGGSFFFSRDYNELRRADKFFTTLAFQLANNLQGLKPKICNAIRENIDIPQQFLRNQWKLLVLQPLLELERETNGEVQAVICVVDALDECEGDEDAKLVVQLLAELGRLKARQLRVFITSRPETTIQHGFGTIPTSVHQTFALHNIEDSIARDDISLFVRERLAHVQVKRNIPSPWPGEESLALLLEKAGSLFIYAATVCRFVDQPGWSPDRLLSMVVKGDESLGSSHLAELDRMYTKVVSGSIASTTFQAEILLNDLNRIVGSIAVLSIPLSARALAGLLNIQQQTLRNILGGLHSVLDIPHDEKEPIRLLHPSFREFLLDERRCGDPAFRIDSRKAHYDLFMLCLHVMRDGLKKDICGLRVPDFPTTDITEETLEKCFTPELRYACRFWGYHLQQSDRGGFEDDVSTFLQQHTLHWLEALACLRLMSEGGHIMQILTKLLNRNLDVGVNGLEARRVVSTRGYNLHEAISRLKDFRGLLLGSKTTPRAEHNLNGIIHDIKRFLLGFQGIISLAPLQLYCSAILFSPSSSWIRTQFFNHIPDWIGMFPVVNGEWGPTLRVIGNRTHSNVVAFSPDGRLLASLSDDKAIELWDSSTGVLRSTLEDHSGRARAVAFSPDGQLLASGSDDGTVRLWDPSTGVLHSILKGCSNRVCAAAFSPDWRFFASASDNGMVELRDLSTGALRSTLEAHSGQVYMVAFSPNGQLLASASEDGTVKLWDSSTGVLRSTLEGRSDWPSAIAFSPDGELFACASRKNLRLWDLLTGALRSTLSASGEMCAFSPDGQLLASGSNDGTVKLWDPSTGALRSILEGHSGSVRVVEFSPDGKLLASESYDGTIRLWDPSIGALHTAPKSQVHVVAFSPNGKLLASASNDGTIELWDPSTGVLRSTLKGHSGWMFVVTFSPDGQLLASASNDTTVKLWDPSTGVLRSILEGHSGWVYRVAFSPDGQLLVPVPGDGTVKLWDLSTGALRNTFKGHSDRVHGAAFSPDGRLLAFASMNGIVKLWDPSTGVLRSTLKGHSRSVQVMAFSPDGRLLASASVDGTVKLWDPSTGVLRSTLKDHSSWVRAMTFSPDGELLVSASHKTLRIYDSLRGRGIRTIATKSDVGDLAFSEDGCSLSTNVETFSPRELTCGQRLPMSPTSPKIALDYPWITYAGQRIVWPPSEYLVGRLATRGGVLVSSYDSQVSFFSVEPRLDSTQRLFVQ